MLTASLLDRITRRRRMAAAAASAAALAGAALLAASPAGAQVPETATHPDHIASAHAAGPAASGTSNLVYGGGPIVASPTIYIVYWGSQWGTGSTVTNDPSGVAPLQLSFFQHAYGNGDTWSNSVTQYCQGVPAGTTQCNGAGTPVGHPAADPVGGTWLDSGVTAPKRASQSQIAAEAVRAASHFGVTGTNVEIIVDSPHGVTPSGFGTQYCAWHSSTTANGSSLPYTNMPYVPDAGTACGSGFVATSGGVNSATEGVTIVGGHEYAETVTDPVPNSGWLDSAGAENGDKCAWISSGQGASAVVSLNGASYAVQSLWSNNFNGGAGGCVVSYTSATNQH